MRVKVDLESNALYFRISEDEIEESEEISNGIIFDYNKNGKIVGIEILNLKESFNIEELVNLKVELPTVVNV